MSTVLKFDIPVIPENTLCYLDISNNLYPLSQFSKMQSRIVIIEQPSKQYRFRYTSEDGAHGSLMGREYDARKKKKSFPKMKIENYVGRVNIVVSLCAAKEEGKKLSYIDHVHKLKGQHCNNGKYEISLDITENENIELSGMYIENVAKRNVENELYERYKMENTNKNEEIRKKAQNDAKELESKLNKVCLCINAFGPEGLPLCQPVYSDAIYNQKATQTAQLEIKKKDKCSGSAKGNDEMFILCEKVDKKNIKVRFFEEDGSWDAFAIFGEVDVHHQYAIVLKTPPYKNTEIDNEVCVKIELYRPSDGCTSEPHDFWYTPDPEFEQLKRKKRKTEEFCKKLKDDNDPDQLARNSSSHKFEKRKPANLRLHIESKPNINNDQENLPGTSEILENVIQMEGNQTIDSYQMECDQRNTSDQNNAQLNYMIDELMKLTDASQYGNTSQYENPGPLLTNSDPLLSTGNIQIQESEKNYQEDMFDSVFSDGINELKYFMNAESDGPTSKPNEVNKRTLVGRGVYKKERNSNEIQDDSVKIKHYEKGKKVDFLKEADVKTSGYKLLYQLAVQTATALQKYAKTSEIKYLLETMGHLIVIPDENGDNSIHNAVIHANPEKPVALLNLVEIAEKTPKFDSLNMFNNRIQTPLHLAVHVNSPVMVKSLIRYGANPNLLDRHGNTALHLACIHGKDAIVETLLSKSNYYRKDYDKNIPTLNSFNYDGHSALHLAILADSITIVKQLCAAGADVNLRERNNGKTSLHLAVERFNTNILKELLKQKTVDVNMQTYNGCSALHLACSLESYEAVSLLREANADPYIENYDCKHEESSDEDDLNIKKIAKNDDVHGYNSFDLARDNSEILDLLYGTVPSQLHIKCETEDKTCEFSSNSVAKNTYLSSSNLHDSALGNSAFDGSDESFAIYHGSMQFDEFPLTNSESIHFTNERKSSVDSIQDRNAREIKKNLDSGIALSDIDMMDDETKQKLASLLDIPNKNWESLAECLECEHLISIIKKTSSPTITLLSYIQGVSDLRHGLKKLGFQQALEIVDEYLKEHEHSSIYEQEMKKDDIIQSMQDLKL